MGGVEGPAVEAEEDRARRGEDGHPLAVDEGQEQEAVRSGGGPPGQPVASPALSRPKSDLTISVVLVTFIVQRSGSQPPVLSQNAAISPSGSTKGFAE